MTNDECVNILPILESLGYGILGLQLICRKCNAIRIIDSKEGFPMLAIHFAKCRPEAGVLDED